MIFKHLSKNKKILFVISLVFLAVGILAFLCSPVIFQEGNPWPQIKGITQLTFGKSDMVKLSGSENKYLTKSKGGWDVVDSFLKNKGYEFTEQMGSGYFYKSSGSTIVLIRRQYSRFYVIWAITENKNNNSLAEGLKECLPKSDTASHEKCNELLKQITDYNSCVGAGFSIMKSNPPKCATPDGRTFVQITDFSTLPERRIRIFRRLLAVRQKYHFTVPRVRLMIFLTPRLRTRLKYPNFSMLSQCGKVCN
ncbi:MAG: hypothetical protein WC878_02605 [Candidatus Paceibacterota bacterium]|jgi:hypothetical protein